jgi:pimeloyl-ACP methyl ester carboxylesterase
MPIIVNHQPDFWDTATPDIRSMFADNARTIPLVFFTAPPPMTCDQLRQIKTPALMTYGGDTRPVYRIAAEGAAGCIPGAQLVAIQDSRHLAMVQQSDAFNAVLLQFLATAGSQIKP